MNTKSNRAFTLIELLVVIAIIVVLVAIAAGSFKAIHQSVERTRCIDSMRRIGAALHSYRVDHDGWLPPGYPVDTTVTRHATIPRYHVVPEGMRSPEEYLHVYLVGYLTDLRYNNNSVGAIGEIPFCPGGAGGFLRTISPETRRLRINGSYAINAWLLASRFDVFPLPISSVQVQRTDGELRTISTGFPSKTAFDPSRYPFLLEVRAYGATLWTHNMVHQTQAIEGSGSWWLNEEHDDPGRSHGYGDALNFMFMAGNIETIARNDLLNAHPQKSWEVSPSNPSGMFHGTGQVPSGVSGRTAGARVYFSSGQMGAAAFKGLYPQYTDFQLRP